MFFFLNVDTKLKKIKVYLFWRFVYFRYNFDITKRLEGLAKYVRCFEVLSDIFYYHWSVLRLKELLGSLHRKLRHIRISQTDQDFTVF